MVAVINLLLAISAHQVQLHASQIPLASKFIIVIIRCLLNGNVCQVHESVREVIEIVRIPRMCESTKAIPIQVDSEWLIACDQDIDSQIELLTSNKQWIEDISLYNIWLSLWTLWLPSKLIFPLRDLLQLVKKENTTSLTFTNRLHNPDTASPLELFNKNTVLSRQVISGWKEVIRVGLLHLALPIQHLFMPLQIFNHKILSG